VDENNPLRLYTSGEPAARALLINIFERVSFCEASNACFA
jgi:hypothetical protein